jgi:hypothetical protein
MPISQTVYPAIAGFTVTPSDTTVLTDVRALWVGAAGNVAVRMIADGSTLVFAGVPAGTLLPVQVDKVMATNTTAGSMLGLR